MNCPLCHADTKVVDTRPLAEEDAIRRRRECVKCAFRFTTVEEMQLLDLTVVKRDGEREGYRREKLARGIRQALVKRPFTETKLKRLISVIERDIQKRSCDEITSAEMGEIVMRRLKSFDQVAYIRFASVYRQFEDVKTFQKELSALSKTRG